VAGSRASQPTASRGRRVEKRVGGDAEPRWLRGVYPGNAGSGRRGSLRRVMSVQGELAPPAEMQEFLPGAAAAADERHAARCTKPKSRGR
jgi:hypothetical protein